MASLFPCPNVLRDCDCTESPVRNFSAEDPDVPIYIGNQNNPNPPPVNRVYQHPGCYAQCVSTVSQEAADDCAQRLAMLCSDGSVRPPFVGVQMYENVRESCTVECGEGGEFTWTVDEGSILATQAAKARAQARALACKRAQQRKVCIRDLAGGCVGEAYSSTVTAHGVGVDNDAFWEVVDGSVPSGLVFTGGVGLAAALTGTPTTSGTYVFTVRVTLSDGTYGQREFTMLVVGITPAVLAIGGTGAAYSQQLSASPGSAASQTWLLNGSGAMPNGLSLSTSGLVSGTPTQEGTFTFGVRVEDSSTGIACERDVELTVTSLPTPTAYWALESWSPIGGGFFETPDAIAGNDLNDLNSGGITGYIVAGKIGFGIGPLPDLINFGDNGPLALVIAAAATNTFTFRFWMKIDGVLDDSLLAEHRDVWQIFGIGATQKLRVKIGNPPFFNYDTIDSSVVFTPGVWHRVVIWRDLGAGVSGIAVDNEAPDTTPVVLGATGVSNYLFFGTTTAFPQPYYDELGYWVGYAWTAADRTFDWNGGVGRTWPL